MDFLNSYRLWNKKIFENFDSFKAPGQNLIDSIIRFLDKTFKKYSSTILDL